MKIRISYDEKVGAVYLRLKDSLKQFEVVVPDEFA
jgi:hypothetical protein